jgi:hypothetical protein
MANKIRGDFTEDHLAEELIGKLNHLRGAHLKLPPFEEELRKLLHEDRNFSELWRRIVDASGVIFLGDIKEAADLFNIILELLNLVDAETEFALIAELTNKIVEVVAHGGADAKHAETRISVLANLFNAAFLADNTNNSNVALRSDGRAAFRELRFSVLRALVGFAAAQSKLTIVEPYLANTKDFFDSLSTSPIAVQRSTLFSM